MFLVPLECCPYSFFFIFEFPKPFLTLPFDSYFVRTQSTETFPTYVATSSIACSYFVFPLISHQIWCFLIPSCYVLREGGSNESYLLYGTNAWQ
ncbi:uncharacterized tatc-like protein ymf16 [Phtheirospermum japonicum]|uniref:Uncharacterized tatc-like protein ymf16 n=1 Tax=Phtheirospermum japonicum TaxID=374723 RepID=A0A830DDX3_9LAMI|nr:uncharacterized tatc-like protein ymf16 [Phtheirospermum japonicum]